MSETLKQIDWEKPIEPVNPNYSLAEYKFTTSKPVGRHRCKHVVYLEAGKFGEVAILDDLGRDWNGVIYVRNVPQKKTVYMLAYRGSSGNHYVESWNDASNRDWRIGEMGDTRKLVAVWETTYEEGQGLE